MIEDLFGLSLFEMFREKDLLTNFSKQDLPIYEKAVELYGDNDLFISYKAYDIHGNSQSHWLMSLRTKRRKNLSDFWEIFHAIQKGERPNIERRELARKSTIRAVYGHA
jgi:hypothetical protein